LLNRDYKIDPVVTFFGDRYQFFIIQIDTNKKGIRTNLKNNKIQ
ncbi:DUF434 domain-containing protein, partial [Clostridioides difficile]|nr:DUF434 domain-containing protein [Clostridioides difficile]